MRHDEGLSRHEKPWSFLAEMLILTPMWGDGSFPFHYLCNPRHLWVDRPQQLTLAPPIQLQQMSQKLLYCSVPIVFRAIPAVQNSGFAESAAGCVQDIGRKAQGWVRVQ